MSRAHANHFTLPLLPGERVLFRVNPHVLLLLFPLLLLALALLAFAWLVCPTAHALAVDSRCLLVVAPTFLLAALLMFADWRLTRYTLTSQRVIRERGIIGREVMEIALVDVQDVAVRQGLLGRLLGYGDMLIESAGTQGLLRFSGIAGPLQARRRMRRAITTAKRFSARGGRRPSPFLPARPGAL